MSYDTSSATAHCDVLNLGTAEEAAQAVCDYLVNHSDEIPEAWSELDPGMFVDELASYLTVSGNTLTIHYDCEESNGDPEVFDFLRKHFSCLQISDFCTVHWLTYSSRSGYSSGTNYYDREGKWVDVNAALSTYLNSPRGRNS